ncbi:MAG TPA: hypothetical protein VGO55_03860 [Allosphingosinicella sp.]|jgi:hypothetical protein|nr:hypothetical protein [Allosphingosinicella sp.]
MDKSESALTRRRMMLITGGAIAGAGALIAAPFREEIAATARQVLTSTPIGRGLVSLADAGYEEWGRQVGSVFTLGDGTRLTLAGVRAFPSSGARPRGLGRDRAFAALFDPARGRSPAPDLIHNATHAEYGPLPLFLSAASDSRAPGRMLAVFN